MTDPELNTVPDYLREVTRIYMALEKVQHAWGIPHSMRSPLIPADTMAGLREVIGYLATCKKP